MENDILAGGIDLNQKKKWVDRDFDFGFPQDEYPHILDRLRTVTDRLEKLIGSLPQSLLVRRDAGNWSIQENAGHLIDTDVLFIARLEDYRAGAETLCPAEMSGERTFKADHNSRDVEGVLSELRRQRSEYVASLEALPPEAFGWTALHPRLNKPMRLVDMLYFQSEHDEYHVSRIEELIALFKAVT